MYTTDMKNGLKHNAGMPKQLGIKLIDYTNLFADTMRNNDHKCII